MNPQLLYKHLSDEEEKRLTQWLQKNNLESNSESIKWEEILTPSDDPDLLRRKAIDEARALSARRYAKESRSGKSHRSRYGGKKREIVQVSRKVLQAKERKQQRKDY